MGELGNLLRLAVPELPLLLAAVVLLLINTVSQAAVPLLVSRILAVVTIYGNHADLGGYLLYLGVVIAVASITVAGRAGLFSLINARMVARLRSKTFESLIDQDLSFHNSHPSGILAIAYLLGNNVNILSSQVLLVTAGVSYMFYIKWNLALVTVGTFFLSAVVSRLYSRWVSRYAVLLQGLLAQASESATESFDLIQTVRAHGLETKEKSRYRSFMSRMLRLQWRFSIVYGGYYGWAAALDYSVVLATLAYGGNLVRTGDLAPSDLITFILYTQFVSTSSLAIADMAMGIVTGLGASREVFRLSSAPPGITVADRAPVPPSAPTEINPNTSHVKMVECDATAELEMGLMGDAPSHDLPPHEGSELALSDVHFSYPLRPDIPILNGLSLSIPKNSFTALVGPSGGGKSSVLALLARLYDCNEGCVSVHGRDVRDWSPRALRNRMAMVLQEPQLFSTTVAGNIAYGLDLPHSAVVEAATEAGADMFVRDLSEGYGTPVGARGGALSGGQKQRVAIARALARNPEVLLLDEATSALDSETENHVMESLMTTRSAGMTMVVVAHRLSSIRGADQIIVIEGGRAVEAGSHRELMSRGGRYAALVALQDAS